MAHPPSPDGTTAGIASTYVVPVTPSVPGSVEIGGVGEFSFPQTTHQKDFQISCNEIFCPETVVVDEVV
jgi:hypothetical protein